MYRLFVSLLIFFVCTVCAAQHHLSSDFKERNLGSKLPSQRRWGFPRGKRHFSLGRRPCELGSRSRNHIRKESRSLTAELFKKAGVAYPPKHLALLVFKRSKRMELYARNNHSWHFIKTYPILAASGGPGPKLHEGDRQVPEGIYRIVGLNPKSRFDLSMHINYPNAFDRREAQSDHRHNLGNNIFIHGENRSIGCMAIGNSGIEQLFPLVSKVGISHVRVIIAPDDMRQKAPIYGKKRPAWLPILYRRITLALEHFPEPQHG